MEEAAFNRLFESAKYRDEVNMLWWGTRLELRWMQMESGNREEEEGEILKDDKHWKVHQRFEEKRKDCEKGTVERLELLRNEMNPSLLHEYVLFKPRGGEQGDEYGVDGSVVWLA